MQYSEEDHQDIESVLHEVLAAQNELQSTVRDIYEKVQFIEAQLSLDAPDDEYAIDQAVDALYDKACAYAETGAYISVPYLVRQLQTSTAVAHEIIERLRIDGLLDSGVAEEGEEGEEGVDVFTKIDLKEINDDESQPTSKVTSVYETARELVVREQVCSQKALMDALGINQTTARAVLHELEAAGVVSKPAGRKGRTVLVAE